MNKREIKRVLKKDFSEFIELAEGAKDGFVDFYVQVDDHALKTINDLRATKQDADLKIKNLKEAMQQMRGFVLRFMEDKKSNKIEGKTAKSITYQPSKEETVIISAKEIMVGGKYQPESLLTRDDLIEMLENNGVKTRITSLEETIIKEPSIRVLR